MCENSRSGRCFGSFFVSVCFFAFIFGEWFLFKEPIVFLKRFGGEKCRDRVILPAAFPLFPEKGVRKRPENVGRQTRGENKNSSVLCRNVHERLVLRRETSYFCREPRVLLSEGASRGAGSDAELPTSFLSCGLLAAFTFLPNAIAFAFLFIAGFSVRRRPDG